MAGRPARNRASSIGRRRRACPISSCWPCRRARASTWCRYPTGTSRRPTRTSIRDGSTSTATGVPTLVPHHRAGTAKLLFVTNRERSPQAPDVPTAAEAGYRELTFEGTVGLYGWRDMPAESLKARDRGRCQCGSSPTRALRARALAVGTALRGGAPAEFAAAIAEQRGKIATIHGGERRRSRRSDRCASPGRAISVQPRHSGVEDRSCTNRYVAASGPVVCAVRSLPLARNHTAPAQSWPQRPVKFIVPFGPGAGADISARLLAGSADGALGQSGRGGEPAGRRRSVVAIQAVRERQRRPHAVVCWPSGSVSPCIPTNTRSCPMRRATSIQSRGSGEWRS